jgi:hypothetical protein
MTSVDPLHAAYFDHVETDSQDAAHRCRTPMLVFFAPVVLPEGLDCNSTLGWA